MAERELDAAGITEPHLRTAYRECRRVNARHGRTYFLATRLLDPRQRPAVHALYGFARHVDDLIDEPPRGAGKDDLDAAVSDAERRLYEGLETGRCFGPLLPAVVDTAHRYRIPRRYFSSFLRSMRMDLTVTGYPDRRALERYMHGSAEVIGLQMLPVLATVTTIAEAAPHAAALGKAFQLTNFLRDVAEDLDRDRVYLPADELAAFGVDRDLLRWCARSRRIDRRVRQALADQIATTRAVYRFAHPGIAMLHPVSRPCVATAFTLYSEILARIEQAGHNVFAVRASVPGPRRLVVAAGALARAHRARLRYAPGRAPSPWSTVTWAPRNT
ncbi:MAG TPA: phytoene/squalene synthase family protein [Amycolatopsis sp.]|uniref:phytoene/squalene synthase family protein n=1 Tax=Amycolatopsis sp. TaxID=37632 RepID=UPI002B4845F2|nr:phytoene/squalene synthase family protein [Amycolatopsis sp.]HKS46112.1 phytoene/squalene synthase family protein [Amycolatopsis sp.]